MNITIIIAIPPITPPVMPPISALLRPLELDAAVEVCV